MKILFAFVVGVVMAIAALTRCPDTCPCGCSEGAPCDCFQE